MSLVIPESSPFPRLSYSFSHNETFIPTQALSFNQNIFELLESNQFSSDLSFDLDLYFHDIVPLTPESLQNIEKFFSAGFLGLNISDPVQDLSFLLFVLQKHKNYLKSLAISFDKMNEANPGLLKQVFEGLKDQKALKSLFFEVKKLSLEAINVFFLGMKACSFNLFSLKMDFRNDLPLEYEIPNDFWDSFPSLRRLELGFYDYNVPSAKTFFKGIDNLIQLEELTCIFDQTSFNKEFLQGFQIEMEKVELTKLKTLGIELYDSTDIDLNLWLLKLIRKKAPKLKNLTLSFNKSSISTIIIALIETLAFLKECSLETLHLKLTDNAIKEISDEVIKSLMEEITGIMSLRALEINFTNNKLTGPATVAITNGLEKLKGLKELYLYIGWNNINDESGKDILEGLGKLENLEYLLCDLSQNYTASIYMNECTSVHIVEFCKKMKGLKSLLLNLEGNELKENHYIEIESVLNESNLTFFHVFRKPEIYGLDEKNPNLTYFNSYHQYFPSNIQNISLIITTLSCYFNGCFFQDKDSIKKFKTLLKTVQKKFRNSSLKLHLTNPFIEDSASSSNYPLQELFNEEQAIFKDITIKFSSFLEEGFTLTEGNLIFDSLFQKGSKIINPFVPSEDNYKETLKYLVNFNQSSMQLLLSKEDDLFPLVKNRFFLSNLTLIKFTNFLKMIPPLYGNLRKFFVNEVFARSLVADFPSKIPGYLLKDEELAGLLNGETLSLLHFYAKAVKELKKEEFLSIHLQKLNSLTVISLKKNPNFSIYSWKQKLFDNFEKGWKENQLKTKSDFLKNRFFELKSPVSYIDSSHIALEAFYEEIKAKMLSFEFPEVNSFYQGFLEELIDSLPSLKRIDFLELLPLEKYKDRFIGVIEEEKKEDILENEEIYESHLEEKLKPISPAYKQIKDSDESNSEDIDFFN